MLQIIGEGEALLYGEPQKNILWHDLPDGDFMITVHMIAKPIANFQAAGIYIYEDIDNYVTIKRGYCDLCDTGGGGFYMDYKISGGLGNYQVKTNNTDVYLRLVSQNDAIAGFYATEPDQWIRLGRFGNYFQFKRVGIGVSNCHSHGSDVVGQYDYFEISTP